MDGKLIVRFIVVPAFRYISVTSLYHIIEPINITKLLKDKPHQKGGVILRILERKMPLMTLTPIY